ncbi:MAG: hypothetical protein AAF433_09575 [Bacteroidota bacterium]
MKFICKACIFCSLLFSINLLSAQSCATATTTVAKKSSDKANCDVRHCPPGCVPEACAEMVSTKACTPAQSAACQSSTADAAAATVTVVSTTPSCRPAPQCQSTEGLRATLFPFLPNNSASSPSLIAAKQ